MIIKTIQWNIGGGKARKTGDNPGDVLAYSQGYLEDIIELLQNYNPDIVTIQESHTSDGYNQAEILAKELELKYFVNDVYAESHVEKGQWLSQCVLSRFPMEKHYFSLFLNPKFETKGPKGEHWVSHDKGVTSCIAKINGDCKLNIKTSHSIPLRRFHLNAFSQDLEPLRKDMAEKLKPESDIYIYQGDLNYNGDDVEEYLPNLFENGVKEVTLGIPTTPKGRNYDRVIYKGIKHKKSIVSDNVLTDHFPIYSEFEANL